MIDDVRELDSWKQEFVAGPDQVIVVYQPADTSVELDAQAIVSQIAEDATLRAEDGFRILSMTSMPLRHGGTIFGNNGSGFETKVAVAVVYERVPRAG